MTTTTYPMTTPSVPDNLRILPRDVAIRELLASRLYWEHYSGIQRGSVWDTEKKRYFIDTCFRGNYLFDTQPLWFDIVANAEGLPVPEDNDGRQRLGAIFDFVDGKFRTFTETEFRQYTVAPLPIVVPGKTFKSLAGTPELEAFLSYTLHFVISENAPEWLTQERWRRWNTQQKPTPGERLHTHTTPAVALCDRLSTHPIWDREIGLYRGKTSGKQVYEMCCNLLFLRLVGWPREIKVKTVDPIIGADGWQGFMTSTLEQELVAFLDGLRHVFWGVRMLAKTNIIALAMAGWYLESQGVSLIDSQYGCLATWHEKAKYADHMPNAPGWVGLMIYGDMGHKLVQERFMNAYRDELRAVAGLHWKKPAQNGLIRP